MTRTLFMLAALLLAPTSARNLSAEEELQVDTEGVSARILYEAVIDGGHLPELTDRYKLRVTAIAIAPGGYVGDHNHLGPGIRQMTKGEMEYILPAETVTYRTGDFFFETGDISHRVEDESGRVSEHLLFEILPAGLEGASLIPPRARSPEPAVAAADAAAVAAIPLLQRGPQHERLDSLIGEWRVETERFLPANLEVTSRVTFSWKYDGSWLEAYDPTELEGTGTIHNVMLMAYDDRLGVWQGAWLDNVSPTMIPFQARWTDEETFELDTGEIEFAGRPHRAVATYRRLSECTLRRELEWSWDGEELELAAVSELEKVGCSID